MASQWIRKFLSGGLAEGNRDNASRNPPETPNMATKVGRKRSRGSNDLDEISVSTTRPRQPLSEVSHNKRRRYLDHVLIKNVDRHDFTPYHSVAASPLQNLNGASSPPPAASIDASAWKDAGLRKKSRKPIAAIAFDEESSADELSALPTMNLRKPTRERNVSRVASASDDDFAPIASSEEDAGDDDTLDESNATRSRSAVTDDSGSELPRKSTAKARVSSNGASAARQGTGNKSKKMMANLFRGRSSNGLDLSLPPLCDNQKIFEDLGSRALQLGLRRLLPDLGRPLRVATFCSGTESPLLALQDLQEYMKSQGVPFEIEHVMSAEIVPFKQAYIERTFRPPLIIRDITELINAAEDETLMATNVYGAKVLIPTNIDIVIAGTSCVDYSNLNKKKKGIDDQGESGDTFGAVLDYCKAARTSIVVLENVFGAPWDEMLEKYERADYLSTGMHLDTKDFYLPQTRQRGYMICLDKRRLDTGQAASATREQIVSLMKQFKRPASSPASSFLQSNSSASIGDYVDDENARKEIAWSACALRHSEERSKRAVGRSRPYSQWHESGTTVPLDHGNRRFLMSQVERVKDYTDIATLRKLVLKDGSASDPRYKRRYWNYTQNIDQDQDSVPIGVLSCVTPSGDFLITDQNRIMTAREKLAFHGIDTDKVSFTIETSKQLGDLAGNAMSKPVVGAVMMAALIAGSSTLRGHREIASQGVQIVQGDVLPDLTSSPQAATVLFTNLQDIDVAGVLAMAEKTKRQCSCEGSTGLTTRDIQQCCSCGHTACVVCSGNPVHDYLPGQSIHSKRLKPGTFADYVRSAFPLRIRPPRPNKLHTLPRADETDPDLHTAYVRRLKAVSQEHFGIQDPRRSSRWTIVYRSETSDSRVELRLDGDAIELSFFVEPLTELPCNDPLREALKEPVARAKVKTSMSDVQWRWRSSSKKRTAVAIQSSTEQSPTLFSRYQIPTLEHLSQPQTLTIGPTSEELDGDIAGRYDLLPSCGTSFESCYRRQGGKGAAPALFLFHDPDNHGPANLDAFVFSTNRERLEHNEARHVEASIAPLWKPWAIDPDHVEVDVSAYHWVVLPGTVPLQSVKTTIRTAHADNATGASGCRDFTKVIAVQVEAECENKEQLSNSHKWVADVVKQQLPVGKWFTHSRDAASSCQTCAPSKPTPKWQLKAPKNSIERYEDPQSAATYEAAIKRQPVPAMVQVKPMPSSATPTTTVSFGVNLHTLTDRARAKLPRDVTNVAYTWQYTNAAEGSNTFSRRPFTLKTITGIAPYAGDLDMCIDDFKHQRLSLAWMLEQERGRSCTIEASQDVASSHLFLRVEMRATTQAEIRGGILTDPPGYGKTILSLALIRIEEQQRTRQAVLADMETRRLKTASCLIPTAATLAIVPSNIVQQWTEEIKNKLRFEDGVIAISAASHLLHLSIEDFENAKVIVISRNVLTSQVYAGSLATYAGIPGPYTLSGRPYRDWLRFATENIWKHVPVLQQHGPKELETIVKRTYKQAMASDDFKSYAPSRRLRGKDYKAAGTEKTKTDTKTAASSVLDTKCIGTPLLELFYFNRLIIDEYHELDAQSLAAVSNIKADKRWGLSGTPPIGDSYEVAQMAQLLDVWLPKGSMRHDIMKQKNSRAMQNDMTLFEQFDAQREVQSEATQERIHELSQGFLDAAVRQNDGFNIPYQAHLVPVNLSLAHQVVHSELLMQLIGQDMVVKKTSTKKRKLADIPDRDQRYFAAVKDVVYAEEALSCSAAYFSLDDCKPKEDTLSGLIRQRKAKLDSALVALGASMSMAKSKESERFAGWKASKIDGEGVGDTEAAAMIKKLLQGSPGNVEQSTDGSSNVEMDDETKGTGHYTSKALTQVKDLLVSHRSLRYAQNVQTVQAQKTAKVAAKYCSCTDCAASKTTDVAVSGACGHIVCATCYASHIEQGLHHCPASGCTSHMERHHMFWRSKMSAPEEASLAPYGVKIAVILDLLEKLRDQGDQAIVFVQFKNQIEELAIALEDRGIAAAASVKEFQRQPENEEDKKTVIILNAATGGGAAGLNLQNANHVIFLSPLLRDQQAYEATMEQAIGRVRRHGQEKDIHVHHLVALDTVDVDVLELRERRITALTEQDSPEVVAPTGLVEDALMVDDGNEESNTLVSVDKQNSMQLVKDEDHNYSLRPARWLTCHGGKEAQEKVNGAVPGLARRGQERVQGWGDFGSLEKWSRVYVEGDE